MSRMRLPLLSGAEERRFSGSTVNLPDGRPKSPELGLLTSFYAPTGGLRLNRYLIPRAMVQRITKESP